MPFGAESMKAVRLFEFGGPEKLVFSDYPCPAVGPGDALVKVMAASVSRWDIKYRVGEVHQIYGRGTGHDGGIPGRRAFPMPMQLGGDVAGEVVAVGGAVDILTPGDRVVGLVHPENPSSIAAIRGFGNLSTGVDLPGHTMFGGYAQYVARPADYWIKIDATLDFDQAAAAMWACATAHHIVATRLRTRMNDVVLVTGASGGMGTATLQLAKLAGATVVATTRDAAKRDRLLEYGAEFVVDTGRSEMASLIKEITRGEGVDGAVEFTGAPELMRLCIDAMRMGGTFCPIGGELAALPLRVVDLVSREINVHGVRASTRNDQRIVVELLEKGRIKMPIHAALPLSQVAEAHRMLESGEVVGRIVLHPWE